MQNLVENMVWTLLHGGSNTNTLNQTTMGLLLNLFQYMEAILSSIGYRNSSYFYRRFREKYGCSPVDYRKRETEKKF